MAIQDEIINEIVSNYKDDQELLSKEDMHKSLVKRLLSRILDGEIEHHLGYEKYNASGKGSGNSRNGTTQKTVIAGDYQVPLDIPRDRNGTFEPKIVPKHKRRIGHFDQKVLSLYANGMTVRDIKSHLEELYDVEVSIDLISTITDKVLEEVKEWRNRGLNSVYPIVFIDGFVIKCRLEGRVTNRTIYVVYGINVDGLKEVLGLWMGVAEGAKYWMQVLTELRNRGLKDIFIICGDGLRGLPEAIEAIYPKATFQTCIVHKVRSSLRYVPHKEMKAVAADLKKIYTSDTEEMALERLDEFELEWGEKYRAIVDSWRKDWDKINPFFQYTKEIRKVIYTTNIIESLNNTLRKSIRNRGHFPTEEAAFKVLYLAIKNISYKWTMPVHNWKEACNQFAILYGDRFTEI